MNRVGIIFKDKLHEQWALITDEWKQKGATAKCLFAFYDNKNNCYQLSWTTSDLRQIQKNPHLNEKINFSDLPSDLQSKIEKELKKRNLTIYSRIK